ncbi:nuclear transport factor 2 family protein [Novosphingobium sp.]|uniref:nuclear transport factor 2 family protein n=1 Tax=Novosphingobium sp. TaxID=1874826 RepID=UPI00286E34D7|nr:nuclear transport factor 2 family protein [Novosphingobium sp.]
MKTRTLLIASAIALLPQVSAAKAPADARIAALEARLDALTLDNTRAHDRAAVENLFGRYMTLHNAFRDPEIIPLWVKKGTPDVRAQYSNNGVYTNWDNIMSYHAQRPNPPGKLIYHFLASPIIEVAADGKTAKGMWLMSGLESGLTAPEAAKGAPDFMYEKNVTVDGKKVWMHTVYAKYGVDFIKQDGAWKIWHFHCFEVARAPYGLGWIPFAAAAQDSPFADDLMYFGEDGKPVMMPRPDGPATIRHNPYRTDKGQSLDLKPPVPYRTFAETFAY